MGCNKDRHVAKVVLREDAVTIMHTNWKRWEQAGEKRNDHRDLKPDSTAGKRSQSN